MIVKKWIYGFVYIGIHIFLVGCSLLTEFNSPLYYFSRLSGLIGYSSLFWAVITSSFFENRYSNRDPNSHKYSLFFSLFGLMLIISHVIGILFVVPNITFFFPIITSLDYVWQSLGCISFYFIIITLAVIILKKHLKQKLYYYLERVNNISLILVYLHVFVSEVYFRNVGIFILFTAMLIISIEIIIFARGVKENELQIYQEIVKSASNAIFYKDLNSTYLMVNEKTLEVFGRSREEVIGKNDVEIMCEEEARRNIRDDKIVFKTGKRRTITKQMTCPEGEPYWFEAIKAPYYDRKGAIAGLFGIARDVTAQTLSQNKLEKSEKRYKHLFETSPCSIMLLNPHGTIVYCNSTTTTMLGYEKSELIGTKRLNLTVKGEERLPYLRERMKKLFEEKDPGPDIHQLRRKDGTIIWVNALTSMIQFNDKTLIQIISEDITEKKKAQELIKEENRKLKELEQMRKDLISRISHELKTPLVSIKGVTELIMQIYQDKLDKKDMDLLEILEKGENRLEQLIENLIDISRIEYKELTLKKQSTDLCHLIRECSAMIDHLLLSKNLSLHVMLPEILILHIDPIRIEQVISNLLLNAIKHTPSQGEITITGKKSNSHIEISIHDSGVGLTLKEKERLFTRFGKIERYEKGLEEINIQGVGLGLYICKNIIKMHGGKIWAESEGRHKGSTFTFSLPK